MRFIDAINAGFEGSAGAMVWFSIHQLWRDKSVRGVHPIPTVFFNVWGFWNVLFYSSLHQWYSLAGGVLLTGSNTIQTSLILYYLWKEHHEEISNLSSRKLHSTTG